jgi:hypothetical protein
MLGVFTTGRNGTLLLAIGSPKPECWEGLADAATQCQVALEGEPRRIWNDNNTFGDVPPEGTTLYCSLPESVASYGDISCLQSSLIEISSVVPRQTP